MFKSALSTLYIAAATLLLASTPLRAAVLVDITGGPSAICSPCGSTGSVFGYKFELTTSYAIDGLGVWDQNPDGLSAPSMTGLWSSTGTLLASVLVGNTDDVEVSASTDGRWLVGDISTLTLGPGQYLIGSLFFGDTSLARFNATPVTVAGLTILSGATNALNSGFSVPSQTFDSLIFGPTLREASAVPLPSSLLLSGLGLAALAGSRRQRRPAR
jgi:PEP-CTERM motif